MNVTIIIIRILTMYLYRWSMCGSDELSFLIWSISSVHSFATLYHNVYVFPLGSLARYGCNVNTVSFHCYQWHRIDLQYTHSRLLEWPQAFRHMTNKFSEQIFSERPTVQFELHLCRHCDNFNDAYCINWFVCNATASAGQSHELINEFYPVEFIWFDFRIG